MNTNCTICVTKTKPTTILLATDYWLVILSLDQGYLGRSYITLRDHKENLNQLSEAEWQDYIIIVKRLESACKQGLGATLFNWSCLMNNAYRQKPYTPHVHWHFRPRYEKPVTIIDTMFEDPEFGSHYDRLQKRTVDDKTFATIIDKIKANL